MKKQLVISHDEAERTLSKINSSWACWLSSNSLKRIVRTTRNDAEKGPANQLETSAKKGLQIAGCVIGYASQLETSALVNSPDSFENAPLRGNSILERFNYRARDCACANSFPRCNSARRINQPEASHAFLRVRLPLMRPAPGVGERLSSRGEREPTINSGPRDDIEEPRRRYPADTTPYADIDRLLSRSSLSIFDIIVRFLPLCARSISLFLACRTIRNRSVEFDSRLFLQIQVLRLT